MKNKSFYFLWKTLASPASFSTKNKTLAYSKNVLKVDVTEAEKSGGVASTFKMTCSHAIL
jgi:hypothetical protein